MLLCLFVPPACCDDGFCFVDENFLLWNFQFDSLHLRGEISSCWFWAYQWNLFFVSTDMKLDHSWYNICQRRYDALALRAPKGHGKLFLPCWNVGRLLPCNWSYSQTRLEGLKHSRFPSHTNCMFLCDISGVYWHCIVYISTCQSTRWPFHHA